MSDTFDHGYALLIAVNESAANAALPDVIKDVEALRDVLVHPQRCGYAADNVKVISAKASTRAGIVAGLDWLKAKLDGDKSENATAIIYYTGHGHVQDGSHFLIPYDINLSRIKTSAIRAEDFAADIAALRPKRLLVMLDCCHAAGMEVKDLGPISGTAIPAGVFMQGEKSVDNGEKGLEALALGAGRAVLSSSQQTEKSWVRKDRAMSIFTYHLIEALTGHAQPQAGATEVLVSDVMSHVWRTVPTSAQADYAANQNPEYQVSGNFPIAQLLGGKGLTAGQAAPDPLTPPPASPAPTPRPTYQATNTGSGAIAQGTGSTAVGERGVFVRGNSSGAINTGTQITGDYVRGDKVQGDKIGRQINTGGGAYVGGNVDTGGGEFVGRDKISSGVSGAEIQALFAQLLANVVQHAPPDRQEAAVQETQKLHAEVAKGKQADDGKVAKIIDGLAGLVPGAIGAVVSAFANPILGAVAGPVTKYVLDKLKGN